MYKENQKLILTQNVGVEDTPRFIPKGTEVEFVKVIDDQKNISKAMLVIQYEDRQMVLPELALVPKDVDTVSVLKDFNNKLIAGRPELKKYHHNFLMRFYYGVVAFFSRLLNPFRVLYTKLFVPVKTQVQKDDALTKELKKLMEEE